MAMSTAELAQLRAVWAERVADFRVSGVSQRQWAQDHGVTVHQLGYWLRRLPVADPNGSDSAWVGLRLGRAPLGFGGGGDRPHDLHRRGGDSGGPGV